MTSSCVACAIETFSDNIFSRRSIIIPFKACKVKLARTIISYWFLPVRVLWYYASHSNREFVFYHLSKNHVQYFYSRILWSKRDLSYIYTPLTFQQHAWFWFCTRNWRLVQLAELIQKSESEISGYQRPRTRPGRLSGSGEAEYADEGPSRKPKQKFDIPISWKSDFTVGELRSGVTGFATIYATGSHRFMLQVRNDERDEINLRQKNWVNLTYDWLMYVIISPWNIIELCRTFRRDVATKKRQIVTFEVKNLRNNREKINNFAFWRKLTTVMGVWLQAFVHTVI